ncbi:MAG: hypothetical protein ABSE16_14765 [Verrucomicrobiota bacterium]
MQKDRRLALQVDVTATPRHDNGAIFVQTVCDYPLVATSELLELAKDRAWLVKLTNAVNPHWHRQNTRKKNPRGNASQNGDVLAMGKPLSAGDCAGQA